MQSISATAAIAAHPKVFDVILKTATAAAQAASAVHGAPKADIGKALGAAIAAAVTDPDVQAAAADTSSAVTAMPAEKPWWQSLTINAGLAGVIASGIGIAGIAMTGGDVQEILKEATAIITAGTSILAIFGRIRAKTSVG